MLKLALCQTNTKVGDFLHNVDKVTAFLRKAGELGAEVAVFPELCLSSYPPLDLLDRPDFVAQQDEALKKLESFCSSEKKIPSLVIFGAIGRNEEKSGKLLQNLAIVLEHGKVIGKQPKRLLPTYDVFDESRYFEPGTSTKLFKTKAGQVGVTVCEDAWFDDSFYSSEAWALKEKRAIYKSDPASDLKGAELCFNISASPFELNKRARRKELLSEFVKRAGAPFVYVNQVGANDEILFDGGSLVFSSKGEVLFEMPDFREAIALVDFKTEGGGKVLKSETHLFGKHWEKAPEAKPSTEIELLHEGLVTGIRDYFSKTGFSKAVIGLSGGIDSAVVACLAAEALGSANVLGVAMPSQYSSSHSLADADALARNIGLEYRVHSIKFIFSSLLMELKPSFGGLAPDVTEENMQARLRAIMLTALANKRKALVLTTGNKSELAVGYCTTYGDMVGALAPLGDVYKTRVYELARYINEKRGWIPKSSIDKPPSAELRPDQKDQDSLPEYAVLDRILELHLEGLRSREQILKEGFDAKTVDKVLHLIAISEFKRRQAAPALKTTSKAFGLGRRIPIAKNIG